MSQKLREITRLCAFCLLFPFALGADDYTLSGKVTDALTGSAATNVVVEVITKVRWVGSVYFRGKDSERLSATPDRDGRYRLTGLPAGPCQVGVRGGGRYPQWVSKSIEFVSGRPEEVLDFALIPRASVRGRVTDAEGRPLAGFRVHAVEREWSLGEIRGFLRTFVETDAEGGYELTGLDPGRPLLLWVKRYSRVIEGASPPPPDLEARRPVPWPAYYAGSPAAEGAVPIVLRAGETREDVDLRLPDVLPLCAAGRIVGMENEGSVLVRITEREPSSGYSSAGALLLPVPAGKPAADGVFRICGLAPGDYTLSSRSERAAASRVAYRDISLAKRDLDGLLLAPAPAEALDGEVVWDREFTDPPRIPVQVNLTPLRRFREAGEDLSARLSSPGAFRIPNVTLDEYAVEVIADSERYYVRDVSYGMDQVQYRPLRVGAGPPGARLRVLLGSDGGTLTVRCVDRQGKAARDATVILVPAWATQEASVAAAYSSGATGVDGFYRSRVLAPGAYSVLATSDPVYPGVDAIAALWRARSGAKTVVVPANGHVEVTVEPGALR